MAYYIQHESETRDEFRCCLKGLKVLIEEDEYLCHLKTEDRYLMRYVECGDLDTNEAFNRMKLFYNMLQELPQWFSIGCPKDKKVIIDKDIRIMPREFDKEGRPLYIVKLGTMDSSTMDLVKDVIVVDDFFIETLMLSGNAAASKGLCVIIDVANFSWKLMRWLTPTNINNAIRRIMTMPIKEYRFHVINSSFFIQAAIKVVWPFLPQRLKNSIRFHYSNMNGLYEEVDQDVLPVEYGGKKETPYSEYHSDVYQKNMEIAKSFKYNRILYLENFSNNKTKST